MVGSYSSEKQTLANLAADQALTRRSSVPTLKSGDLPAELSIQIPSGRTRAMVLRGERGGSSPVVPRPGRKQERRRGPEGERGKGGRGRGRSLLQYALEQDEISAHRRKPRKERGRGTGGKWGKSCCISLSNYRRRSLCEERRKRTKRLKKK